MTPDPAMTAPLCCRIRAGLAVLFAIAVISPPDMGTDATRNEAVEQ